jgi:hypothetical protein
MIHIIALSLLGLSLALPARAGAWLRDDGAVFLSFGSDVRMSDDTRVPLGRDPRLYMEWGVGPRTTLALAVNAGPETAGRIFEARVIRPLPLPEGWGVAAASGGLARRTFDSIQYDAAGAETDQVDRLASVGLAWGQGSDAGWITAEGRLLSDLAEDDIEVKLDLTGGYHMTPAWSAMLQFHSGLGHAGDPYARVRPSVIHRVSDRLRLNAGASHTLTGDRGTGLFFETWLEF